MRKIVALVAAGAVWWALAGGVSAKTTGTVVFEDPAGDAGNQDSGIPGFSQAGFDLVGGSINKVGKNLEFTITHAAMPPNGSAPEAFRLLWHFFVDKDEYRFTIKSADIGKPDVLSQTGQERVGKVDVNGHFRLETWAEGLNVGVNTPVYKPVAYLEGKFDPATKTVTVILPMKLVKAKKGSTISGGTGAAASSGCQICWIPHYAERSLTPLSIIDSATMSTTYRVR